MFRDIFKRREAVRKDARRERGFAVAPVSALKDVASQTDSTVRLDIAVDETMLALDRELSGLARLEVGQAAKERGWATLQRELERRPVRTVVQAPAKGVGTRGVAHAGTGSRTQTVRSHSMRWALGAVAAAVAVVATLIGVYAAGPEGPAFVDNGGSPTTAVSVVTSDSTESTDTTGTTPSSESTDTTGTTPSSGTTDTTVRTTPSTGTTGGSPGTGTPTTTQPTPTTAGDQQNVTAQLENTAEAAAGHLADLIVRGDGSSARSLVDPAAYDDLAQITRSLAAPSGFTRVDTRTVDGVVRVTVEFYDSEADANGDLTDVVKTFVFKVRVNGQGAMVTAINLISSERL
jgi:hypothetical protein